MKLDHVKLFLPNEELTECVEIDTDECSESLMSSVLSL